MSQAGSKSNPIWWQQVVPMLLVALALRLGVAIFLPLPDDFMYLSEPGWTAANLVAGRGYTFDFYGTRPDYQLLSFVPPLHPWFMALALLFGNPAVALGILQALLGTLTVWMIRRLALRLTNHRIAALVGWGAALYPSHILCTSQPISAVLHAACLMAILLAAEALLQRPGIGRAVLTGGATGLFALSRPQILMAVPVVALWLWFRPVRGRIFWQVTGSLALAAVLMVLPWSVRNAVVLGRPLPTPTNGGVTFWNGNNPFTTGSGHDVYADKLASYTGVPRDTSVPDVYEHPEPYPFPSEIDARLETMPELELDRAFYQAGLDYISQNPADWLKLEVRKLVSFWWFRPNLGANPLYRDHWTRLYRMQYAGLLLLTVTGLAVAAKQWRDYLLLYFVLAYYTVMHLIFNVLTRYRWEIELLLLIFAALALEKLWQRLPNRRPAG